MKSIYRLALVTTTAAILALTPASSQTVADETVPDVSLDIPGGGQLLASSGLLYSAHGQREATREISLMGSIASAGVLLMLLLVFLFPQIALWLPKAIGW